MEYQEIIARQKEVLAREPKPIPEDRMAAARELYTKRNKKSLELFEKAKSVIPGGVEHNLSQNNPFPLAMDGARGTRVGYRRQRYIDYLMCGAPIMLGRIRTA